MHKLFLAIEKTMGMDDATWARHTNPLSGWTRLSILPLIVLSVWSRVWIGWWALVPILITLVWTWVNPRLFPPPASIDNWMSYGVLGEKIWLRNKTDPAIAHHRSMVRILTFSGILGAVFLIFGLILLSPILTISGLLVTVLSKLWFLDRMVWVYRDMHLNNPNQNT